MSERPLTGDEATLGLTLMLRLQDWQKETGLDRAAIIVSKEEAPSLGPSLDLFGLSKVYMNPHLPKGSFLIVDAAYLDSIPPSSVEPEVRSALARDGIRDQVGAVYPIGAYDLTLLKSCRSFSVRNILAEELKRLGDFDEIQLKPPPDLTSAEEPPSDEGDGGPESGSAP